MIYSWHQEQWTQIATQWDKQPNAWLFTGRQNTGKTTFARTLAQALLCEQASEPAQACGQCPSCHLFAQNSHPDFYVLSPEEEESATAARKLQQIKIDEVRAVLEPLSQTSMRGGRRVVLIHPAEAMNIQAANALLKMLEEPPQAVVFLLVSHHKDRLLPTIKSRCRQLHLPAPTQLQALQYLQEKNMENAAEHLAFHSGAPLFEIHSEHEQLRSQLLQWLSEPRLLSMLDFATAFDKQKLPLAALLDWLDKWLIDWALVQQNLSPLYYPSQESALQKICNKITASSLFHYRKQVYDLLPYGHHSLNTRLQIEALLIDYLNRLSGKVK